jgi:ABC-2 type transport system ATP-binding protein
MDSAPSAPAQAERKPGAATSLAPAAPLIEVQGLCRSYGQLVAVRDLSFEVGHGEVVGFLGPNGAGKSTTLRMIVGYLGPSHGRVRVAGHDVVEEPLRARQAIGYMPESAPLYPEMRVSEYLAFRARLKRIARSGNRREVERVMSLANVTEVGRSLIGTLSRGFRQRVALADALLGNPPLLILDEPTAGLDPNQIHDVRELIGELGDTHTVLLSTHILSEVESICNRAIVIDRGTLVAAGPIHELRRRRSNPRASITVHDVGQQALPLLLGSEHVLGVTPTSATPSLLPPQPERDSRAPGVSSPGLHDPDAIVSFVVTFQPGIDAHACLEDLVALLVHAQIRVREARLDLSSLEDVFRQLTGAGAEPT